MSAKKSKISSKEKENNLKYIEFADKLLKYKAKKAKANKKSTTRKGAKR